MILNKNYFCSQWVMFLGLIIFWLNLGFIIIVIPNFSFAESDQKVSATFVRNLKVEPISIHPISYEDYSGEIVLNFLMDSLAKRNKDTYDWEPSLAKQWMISNDKKTIVFNLKDSIFFHDGSPITAEDVKFSYEALFLDFDNAPLKRIYFDSIASAKVLNSKTIEFKLKDSYFKNFDMLAELYIIPKHVYQDLKIAKTMHTKVVGSGPYSLENFERGQSLIIRKFSKWYGFKKKDNLKNNDNLNPCCSMERIKFLFVRDPVVALQMSRKGEIDFDWPISSEIIDRFNKPIEGVSLHKVENKMAKRINFIGWNLQKEIFKDLNVRKALAHLMNREEMNLKLRGGLSLLARGPHYLQSIYSDLTVKHLLFDVELAKKLLYQSGWEDRDQNGILEKISKNEKENKNEDKIRIKYENKNAAKNENKNDIKNEKKVELKFEILYASKEVEKYLTWYQEDLKKVGIHIHLKYLEWELFMKAIEKGNFDAMVMAWNNSVEWDPKQVWHSSRVPGQGSNYLHYKNKKVDALIDSARIQWDLPLRTQLLKKAFRLIAEDVPCVWMFNEKYEFYTLSKRVQSSKESFEYDIGSEYWQLK